jgi:CRP-like cAMP-binding protein
MKLNKNGEELMEIVPMNPNTMAKLLEILKKVRDLGELFDNYLKNVMVAKLCLGTHDLHKKGKITKSAYYISSGYIIAYYYTKTGELRVVKILGPGYIAAGQGFLNHKESKYNLMILKDTLVLEITYDQMQNGYAEVPGMQELALLTKEDLYDEDLLLAEMLSKTGEERIIDFYRKFPMLLKLPRLIQDKYIASLLHLSVPRLQHIRVDLFNRGLLPVK